MNILYWIWLSLAVTPGSNSFGLLISKYPSAKEIYELEKEDIISVIGSKSKDLRALSDKNLDKAEEIREFCEKKKVGLLTYDDSRYPENLKKIKNPPVMLYYRGVLPDFKKACRICKSSAVFNAANSF